MRPSAFIAVLLVVIGCAHTARTETGDDVEISLERRPAATRASLRGLSVAADGAVWISGTGGTVLRSTDAGETYSVVSVEGADSLDFRDVHGFDSKTALVMSAGSPGVVYRTDDGGGTWSEVHRDERPEIFLDAMDFVDVRHGVAFGDPIEGRFALLLTDDGGRTWRAPPHDARPAALPGEAGFAASGTCLVAAGGVVALGTGGNAEGAAADSGRVLFSDDAGETWRSARVPIARSPSAGVFSVCRRGDHVVAVGGDHRAPDDRSSNCAISDDGGWSWRAASSPPHGYRSVVIALRPGERDVLLAAGTNGLDASFDGGDTWRRVATEGINVLAAAPGAGCVHGAGPEGAVYRIRVASSRGAVGE